MRHIPRRRRRWTSDFLPLEPRLCLATPPSNIFLGDGPVPAVPGDPHPHEFYSAIVGPVDVQVDTSPNALWVSSVDITIQNGVDLTQTFYNAAAGHFARLNGDYEVDQVWTGVRDFNWAFDEHPGDRTITVTVNYVPEQDPDIDTSPDTQTFTVHVQAPTISNFTISQAFLRFGPFAADQMTSMAWGTPPASAPWFGFSYPGPGLNAFTMSYQANNSTEIPESSASSSSWGATSASSGPTIPSTTPPRGTTRTTCST